MQMPQARGKGVKGFVVCQVQPELGQRTHAKVTVNKQTLGDKVTTKSKPCLDLITVEDRNLVPHNLACERALDLQQDNGAVKRLKVTVRTAGYFAIKRVILGKVE